MKTNYDYFEDIMGQQVAEEENDALEQLFKIFRNPQRIFPGDAVEYVIPDSFTGAAQTLDELPLKTGTYLAAVTDQRGTLLYIVAPDESHPPAMVTPIVRKPVKRIRLTPEDLQTIAVGCTKLPDGSLRDLLQSFLKEKDDD